MVPNKPTYKLNYQKCKTRKEHKEESLNYVCLNKNCQKQCLICSICKYQSHENHETQPLKIFFEKLYKKYMNSQINYNNQLNRIENEKNKCLYELKETIEKICLEVQAIEEGIVNYFEGIRINILEQKSKQQSFCDFYESLQTGNSKGETAGFLIQNYVGDSYEKIQQNFNVPTFGELEKSFSSVAHKLITDLKSKQICPKKEIKQPVKWPFIQKIKSEKQFFSSLMRTENIKISDKLLKQNLYFLNSQQMTVLPLDVRKFFDNKNMEMKVRIASISKQSFLYIGVIEKQAAKELDLKFPLHPLAKISPQVAKKYKGKIFCLGNQGVAFGHTTSDIKTFSHNSTICMKVNGNTVSLILHKKTTKFIIQGSKQYFPFIGLMGFIQIQINFNNTPNWNVY